MSQFLHWVAVGLGLTVSVTYPAVAKAPALAVEPVSPATAQAMLDRVIPLPKEVSITRQVGVPRAAIRVRVAPGAGELEQRATDELRTALGCGQEPGARSFEILLGVLDDRGRAAGVDLPGAATRLRALPNADQAYLLRPVGDDRLILTGLTGLGVHYAALTLTQLLVADSAATVAIPLAEIIDWPDLAQRGMWDDAFTAEQIEWMAAHKLNLVEVEARLGVGEDGRGTVTRLPMKGPEEIGGQSYPTFCWQRGVRCAPIILHFDLLDRTGIYERYPELRGQGVPSASRRVAPCARRPEFAQVLADWIAALAGRPQVEEIAVWLSEENAQCNCDECRAVGQYVMESRAVARAWSLVRERFPGLRLRLLLTQGSFPVNDQILAELPPEIGVTYYHGIKTYDSSRDPMIPFSLREAAAGGRAVGVCPQLTVSWAVVCPWSCPQFVRQRMVEFADKGIGLLSGYATPDIRLYAFSVAAAAEWSWNAHGRDERAFARAWATRNGIADPETAADWAVQLGPTSWDLYGALVPYHFIPQWGLAARMVRSRVRPIPGEDLFRYFPNEQAMDEGLANCDRALALAQRLGEPALVEETLVVRGYLTMVRAIYRIADGAWRGAPPLPAGELARRQAALVEASQQTNEALRRWEKLFGEGSGGGRFRGTLELSEKVTAAIGGALALPAVPDSR
ncbi:MAG: hypothetical protein WDA75_09360 [Candidatus Latescibacterota bacterium]